MRIPRFPAVPALLACALLAASVLSLAHGAAPVVPARSAEPAERVVAILPLGKVRKELLDRVAQELQARMRVKVRFEPPRELPKAAWYAPRKRWRAEKLLEAIDAAPPAGAWKVVAVTEAEISTTKDTYFDWGIAGLGNMGGLACVVSTHIYQKHSKTQDVLLRRVGDLASHEFGHTLGLDHCDTEGCVMSDAKGKAVSSADHSTGHYCARCLGSLPPEVRALVKDDR
jgi:archaemetzincin